MSLSNIVDQDLSVLEEKVIKCASQHIRHLKHPVSIDLKTRLVADLEFDSLDIVEFTMSLEDEFDVKIDDDEMMAVKTINNAVSLVNTHIRQRKAES